VSQQHPITQPTEYDQQQPGQVERLAKAHTQCPSDGASQQQRNQGKATQRSLRFESGHQHRFRLKVQFGCAGGDFRLIALECLLNRVTV